MPVVPALSEKPASPALPLGSPADEPGECEGAELENGGKRASDRSAGQSGGGRGRRNLTRARADAGRAATPASYPGGGDEETGDKATKKKEARACAGGASKPGDRTWDTAGWGVTNGQPVRGAALASSLTAPSPPASFRAQPIDVHKHLAKGSLPLLFRSLTIAFTIVAFALIAELSFKELVPKSGATLTHDCAL